MSIRTKALGLLIALLAVALAGCGAPAKSGKGSTDSGFEEFEIPEDALALRGVVVDQAIVPLQGAAVRLEDGRETNTTEKGTFAFVGMEPGSYLVTAAKPGYIGASTTVTVASADDPIARVQLTYDPGTLPFHETVSKKGLLQCGMGLPSGGSYSICQTPNGAVDILCDVSGDAVCLDYPLQHRGILEIDVQDGLVPLYVQAEAVWEATSANSEVLTWSSASRTRGTLQFNNNTSFTGPSPLVIPWDHGRLVDGEIGQGQIFVFQVFPESGGIGNLVLQQQVELFVTSFYHYTPPEGWTLANDGEPVDPR